MNEKGMRQTVRNRQYLAGGVGLALAMLAHGAPAFAQSTPTSETTNAPSEPLPPETTTRTEGAGDIVVTGSRIRGVAPTGSNVISVGQEALIKTGAVTTQDLINQVPQNVGTGFNESTFASPFGGINSTRGGAINLRGVGPQATLLLLDGHRIVPNGTSGTYIDPSSIPANALQRIEIVADGASAIYGADAVAGVANLILRRDLDGFEVSSRYGRGDDLDQFNAGVVAGTHWSSGRALIAYEYVYRSSLAGRDRSYFTSDNRATGGSDYRFSQCDPGTVQIGTTLYPIPVGTVTSANLVPGPPNRCDYTPFGDILPQQRRHAVAATISQDLADWLSVSLEGQFLSRSFQGKFVSQGGSSLNTAIVIPSTNPYFIRPAGSTANSETINYSFLPQYGALEYRGREQTFNIIGNLNFDLSHGWKASVGGVIGHNKSSSFNPMIDLASLTAARTSTNPATAFNPFGPNSRALIDKIFSGVFEPTGTNKLRSAELSADGPLFSLPGGAVRAAVGGEFVHTSFFGGTQRGTLTARIFSPVLIERDVKSVYGELFVPIFGAENATAGFQSLALSAAVRYDHYSDFGSTTNPKFGITWKPLDGLELRASYGTSFRAPTLNDTITLRPGALVSAVTRADPLAGNAQVPVVILIAGNPDVQPETAKTYSFGGTIAPPSLPGFRLVLNYFSLDYDGQILSVLNDPTILQRANIFQSVIRRFPTPLTPAQVLADPAVAALVAAGAPVSILQPATSYIIDARPLNLGRTTTRGFDFDIGYNIAFGSGRLNAGVSGAYFFNYKVQQTSAAPVIDQINRLNYPLRFKARGAIGWSNERFDLAAYVNYANSYRNPASTLVSKVGSFTTVDAHFGIRLPFAEAVLALDVNNVFDKDPPFIDIDGAYDPTQASAVGRLFALSVRAKF